MNKQCPPCFGLINQAIELLRQEFGAIKGCKNYVDGGFQIILFVLETLTANYQQSPFQSSGDDQLNCRAVVQSDFQYR